MSRWKRGLSFLLTAVILISLLPSGLALSRQEDSQSLLMGADSEDKEDVSLYSMMPLKEERLEVDLTDRFPSELANVRLETLLPKVKIPDGSEIVWTKLGDDQYTVSNKNGTVDLSKEERDTSLEIIVGSADQLNTSNIRYLVTVRIAAPSFDDVLEMSATYASDERGSIRVLDSGYHHHERYRDEDADEEGMIGEYRFTVDETWKDGSAYLSMKRKTYEPEIYTDETEDVETSAAYKPSVEVEPYAIEITVNPADIRNGENSISMEGRPSGNSTGTTNRNFTVSGGTHVSSRTGTRSNAGTTSASNAEKRGFDALTAEVYEGRYLTLEAFERAANAVKITERIWEATLNSGDVGKLYQTSLIGNDRDAAPFFTVVWYRNGNPVAVMPFRVVVIVTPRRDHIEFSDLETIDRKNEAGEEDNLALMEREVREDEDTGVTEVFYQIPLAGLKTAERYNLKAVFRHFEEDKEGYTEPPYSEYGIKVYAGSRKYETVEEAAQDTENARDVTTQIFNTGFSADYSRGIVFSAFNDKGELITCQKIQTVPREALEFGSLYKTNDRDFQPTDPYEGRGSPFERVYQMQSFSYMASDPYTIRADYIRDLARASYQAYGVKVLAGSRSYETYADAVSGKERLTDVTEALLGENGYTADFSKGVVFTAFNSTGERIDRMTIRTEDFRGPSLSEDTYFRMRSANSPNRNPYQVYRMPADSDGYYSNGYQTLFLLDRDGPVSDSRIIPVFYTPDPKTAIYAGHNESGSPQESGVTPLDFVSGRPVHYSAAAENGTHLKNYWITFLTQQSGPVLFVNAANDTEHLDRDTGFPVREVFITGQTGGYHDVFFSNIGDEPIENLSVSLERGDNLYLDSYWTIRENASAENKTLNPFTTTNSETTMYGELPNVGKVRLYPKNIKNVGDIDDTLVFHYDGGEQRIRLSGKIGDVEITTPEGPIKDGVRYVVYSRLLQTNNLYGGNLVSFEITDGQLPEGYELKPNGEIYGVTGETGEYTFTVTATFTYNGIVRSTDSKEYTLTVKDNTDENVNAETDVADGYQVNKWIPDMILTSDTVSTSDEVVRDDSGTRGQVTLDGYRKVYFESNGEFKDFRSLWLNGIRLQVGVDFTVKSGTIEMTVNPDKISEGKNTISMEGRPQGDNSPASKTNENFTVTVVNTSGNNNNTNRNNNNSNNTNRNNNSNNTNRNNNNNNNTNRNNNNSNNNTRRNNNNTNTNNTNRNNTNSNTAPPTAYALHVDSTAHGSVRLSHSAATKGTSIKVTAIPDPGYEVRRVIAQGTNLKNEFCDVDGEGNNYAFFMRAMQVTVSVEFAVMTLGDITDVIGTDWYFDDVRWVYNEWLMRGVTADSFQPWNPMSGVSAVVSLRRLDGVDLTPYYTGEDDGLDNDAWYVAAARWAKVSGILPGGVFTGYESLTRGYVAVMLKNYLEYLGVQVEVPQNPVSFTDSAQMSDEELEAFQILRTANIFRGTDNTMEPQTITTRVDMALLLHRLNTFLKNH